MIKRLLSLVLVSVFLLGACLPGICSADAMYQITEAELTELQTILPELQQNNKQLQQDLAQSKQDLLTAKSQLQLSAQELEKLRQQLTALQAELTMTKQSLSAAQTDLSAANKSLEQYVQEVRSEQTKLKIERDAGWLAAAVEAGLLIFRK